MFCYQVVKKSFPVEMLEFLVVLLNKFKGSNELNASSNQERKRSRKSQEKVGLRKCRYDG